jgi:hypothetical protein
METIALLTECAKMTVYSKELKQVFTGAGESLRS